MFSARTCASENRRQRQAGAGPGRSGCWRRGRRLRVSQRSAGGARPCAVRVAGPSGLRQGPGHAEGQGPAPQGPAFTVNRKTNPTVSALKGMRESI